MKEYIRPEIELVKFNTEAIADIISGGGNDEENTMSGDMS